MISLRGKHIQLRALEPEDLEFLYEIENTLAFWEISHTQTPFSKYTLKKYIEQAAHADIYEAKQLRLLIVHSETQQAIGMIDLFDLDPHHQRAGIGILIHPEWQGNNYGNDALATLIDYCNQQLHLHQLYANILSENTASIALFKKHGFTEVGIKKAWIKTADGFKDELLVQRIYES